MRARISSTVCAILVVIMLTGCPQPLPIQLGLWFFTIDDGSPAPSVVGVIIERNGETRLPDDQLAGATTEFVEAPTWEIEGTTIRFTLRDRDRTYVYIGDIVASFRIVSGTLTEDGIPTDTTWEADKG